MRHSIQNKAFYIFDMAKKIYIKTRHAHMSGFDPGILTIQLFDIILLHLPGAQRSLTVLRAQVTLT